MSRKTLYHFFRLYSGRRRLTVQEKEDIAKALIAKNSKSHNGKSSIWFPSWKSALAMGVLFCSISVSYVLGQRYENRDEYSAKGGDDEPVFTVNCIKEGDEALSEACRRGETLGFRLRSTPEQFYFSAFSKHTETGTIIWYFPDTENDQSIPLYNQIDGGVLSKGIRIGNEHEIGDYEVFGVFTQEPVYRSEIRHVFEDKEEESRNGFSILKTTVRVK